MFTRLRPLRMLSSSLSPWLLLVASLVGCSSSPSGLEVQPSAAGTSGDANPPAGGAMLTSDTRFTASAGETHQGMGGRFNSSSTSTSTGSGGIGSITADGGTNNPAGAGAVSSSSSRASGGNPSSSSASRGGSAQGGRTQATAGTGGRAQSGSGQGGAMATNGGRGPIGLGGRAGTGQGGRSLGAAQGGSVVTTVVSAGSTGTSTAAAAQYVDAVNAVRSAVTEPSNYSGTWAPLPNVTWSDTVAASAQAWADNLASTKNCSLVHESNTGYGENLAAGTSLSPAAAVSLWAGEKELYTYSPKYTQADFDKGSGHYTQLVWRKSIEIGCGSATCGRTVVISCRFNPPGNYLGQSVY